MKTHTLSLAGVSPLIRIVNYLWIAAFVTLLYVGNVAAEKVSTKFSLPSVSDTNVELTADDDTRLHVVCFLGTECPLAKLYGSRLQAMADEFQPRGVQFVGVNSNVQDSMDDLKRYAADHKLTFPIAKDFDRSVAVQLGATRTPEVVVLDPDGNVLYRGRIDDQYEPGVARASAKRHHLRDAISEVLDGTEVTITSTEPVGCLIALPKKPVHTNSDVSFCKQVIRVLQQNCIECHREGEIGPFALQDYDEVVGWSDMINEVIEQHRMPPWHASPDHGSFANARQMPDADKATLREWVDAGMPYGDAADLPPKKQYLTGWRLPKEPDLVVDMHKDAFKVPAEGTVEYQYFVVDPKWTEDKWVTAAQLIPGDRSVVHHAIAFLRPPDGSSFRSLGTLSAYVPGQMTTALPKGYARRVRAGSRIVFQMHYTPNGTPGSDNSRLGLVYADDADVTHEVFALGGIEQEFEIPPNKADHTVSAKIRGLPRRGELLSITPHMHLRGKSFRFFAKSRDEGKTETLLSVPHYDFNWQHNYELTEPLDLANISELRFDAVFDNSANNPFNPDPSEYVTWGDQTWQEMAVAFVAVAQQRTEKQSRWGLPQRKTTQSPEASTERLEREQLETDLLEKQRQNHEQRLKRARKFATDYIAKFDKNDDDHVSQSELPHSVRMFYFRNLDYNRDGLISVDEVTNEAYGRVDGK